MKWILIFIVMTVAVACAKQINETAIESVAKPNYVEFDVSGTEYRWDAGTIGFWWSTSSTAYVIIYSASDSSYTTTFKKYLFIDIKDKAIGTYTSSDGKTGISYYDRYGYAYYDFYSGCSVTIAISKWSLDSITGTFYAKLYCSDTSSFKTLSGTYVSFDSDDVMNPSINVMSVPNNVYSIHKMLYNKAKTIY